MTVGHPYATLDLIVRRTEQRRVLRTIPDWFVTEHLDIPEFPVPSNPIDRVLVESMLREQAQELFKSGPVGFINRMRDNSEWGALSEYLKAVNTLPAFDLADAAEWLRREAHTVEGAAIKDADGHDDWLKRLLVALLLADRLAEDGYFDPRIP